MNVYIGGAKDYSAMQGPAPSGFHLPLRTELQGLKTIMDGLSLTTGDDWRINLHMPFAGFRNTATDVSQQGSYGYYWSSSPASSIAIHISIGSSSMGVYGYFRASGYSVRCFKDSYVTPDYSWTVVQGTLGGAGIFWNQSEGLISITNGTTGYTIQDKNLGATTVYSDGATLSEANCGKYYEWGNNYGFAWTGSVTASSTQVDASSYGPGNYYSSSTFINVYNGDWSSVRNDNLRGGVTGIVSPAELKNAYIGEVYEYSYDFRNKTWSQCHTDGWTVTGGQTPSVGSDGIYYNGWYSNVVKTLDKDFSNANKITFSMYYNAPSNFDGLGFRILKMPGDGNRCGTWISKPKREVSIDNTIIKNISKSGLSAGWYNQTIEYDLVNKTYSYSGEFSDTGSLTDTQITTIRTLNTLGLGLDYAYVGTVSITVE